MYPAARTFWLEPTGQVAAGLRRYSYGGDGHTCADGYHDALTYTHRADAIWDDHEWGRTLGPQPATDRADPAWPELCAKGCGYRFTDADTWQDWQELIYRCPATGTEYVLHQNAPADTLGAPAAGPGAMWDAWWRNGHEAHRGPDGICLMVRCPNGHNWCVDSEARNCTRKGQPHDCWVRHGDPRQAAVTVDKQGDTCAAGAGSVQAGDYHGFLRDGVLTAG